MLHKMALNPFSVIYRSITLTMRKMLTAHANLRLSEWTRIVNFRMRGYTLGQGLITCITG
jgi:hypothetical protein